MAEIRSIWDRDEYKPYKAIWDARREHFAIRESYYDGARYTAEKYRFGWQIGTRLYRGIRPLFLPFARSVLVDAGIIPGRWAWVPDAPDAWREARKALFTASEWNTKGQLFVHYGAMYGHSGLKVADLRDEGRVIVAPVDPRRFLLIPTSAYDSTPGLSIYVETRRGLDGEFEYAEVITPDAVRLYMDGEPFGYEGREAEYANLLGVVPYTEVRHIDSGQSFGESTFEQAIRTLDELNELGSYLADIIKKFAEPQTAITGATKGALKKGDNVWYLPEGAKIDMILAEIDIPGVQGFLKQLDENVRSSLPETAFDELKAKDQIATATLELQLMELVIKVKRCRPNYDEGLERSLRLAGQAAADMGLDEIAPLNDENLDIDNDRPVLRAELDTREKADYLLKSGAPSEAVWEAIGIEQDVIADWNRIKAEHAAQFNASIDSPGETAI